MRVEQAFELGLDAELGVAHDQARAAPARARVRRAQREEFGQRARAVPLLLQHDFKNRINALLELVHALLDRRHTASEHAGVGPVFLLLSSGWR